MAMTRDLYMQDDRSNSSSGYGSRASRSRKQKVTEDDRQSSSSYGGRNRPQFRVEDSISNDGSFDQRPGAGQKHFAEDDSFDAPGYGIEPPRGRKYIGTEDHMQNEGVSMPRPAPHGHGRKHMIPEDHMQFNQGFAIDEERVHPSRRQIIVMDHVKENVMKPVEEIERVKVPTNNEMKDAIKDWLVTVHNMFVFDESKWDREVEVKPRGTLWVVETLTEQKRSISREGPSARLIAEKLAMCQVMELRNFGIRFAGRNDRTGSAPALPPEARVNEENPTRFSPGVSHVLGAGIDPGRQEWAGDDGGILSCSRRHTENVMRRYIASGKDHFDSFTVVAPAEPAGSHGRSKDDDFSDTGLERAIGRGKRYIGTKDNLGGGPW